MPSLSTAVQATTSIPTLYMALELAKEKCLAASGTGRAGDPIRRVSVPLSTKDVLEEVTRARARFRLPADAPVVTVYEAGFSGFWLYRELTKAGVVCIITKSCTLKRNRQARAPKTDRLDAEALQKALIRYHRDGEDELRPIEVPAADVEDQRRLHRERETLMAEKNQHCNRLGSLLRMHGIEIRHPQAIEERQIEELRCADGEVLPIHTRSELGRSIRRRDLVLSQLRDLEAERMAVIQEAGNRCAQQTKKLIALKGIGVNVAWVTTHEIYGWRTLKNRRQVGHATGLVGTPEQSGKQDRDRGISKAGNRQVRRILVEAAWLWLKWQPESDLSKWFRERFGVGKRGKRIGIVALARKLAIALWRYVEWGVIPEGAVLKGER